MIKAYIMNKEPLLDYRMACKITQGVDLTENPDTFIPKNETAYWIKQIVANHSTLRSVRFRLILSAPKSVVMQIIRATKGHPQPFVHSSRPDWCGKERSNDPYEEKMFIQDHTAESFVAMCRQRLCAKTEARTRKFMNEVVDFLKTLEEPFFKALAYCCKPQCEWCGKKCTELKGCGKYPYLSEIIISEVKNESNFNE